jgi:two-component system sensor histidine kinase KdpD
VPPALARLSPSQPRRRAGGYAVAVLGIAALTAVLLPLRSDLTPLSKGFGYLLVVVVAAAIGGLGPGVVASVAGFLTFNFFFIPPYNTFVISRGEYVVVLFVFLGLSLLISTLLARATERANSAEAREHELRALQALSAELVALVPGPEGYESVISNLLQLFGFTSAALFVQDPGSRELREQVAVGCAPGTIPLHREPDPSKRALEHLPLSVGGRVLGLLVLQGDREPISPAESRVLRAFCDQFALVLERDRLLRAATEAEIYRQGDAVRRSLLAAVSHDLRSPLAAIKASVTDLLGDDVQRDAQVVREALTSIDDETDRLDALIANLLDMSRIEGGMLRAHLEGVQVSEVLATCVDHVRRLWPTLDVVVRVGDDTIVRADPVFLDRVGTNLLENAAKAAADATDPRIEVGARKNDGHVVVRVIDHGEGVPEVVREQLFFPFYRVTEREPRLGTGLGLAISKGFLDLMDGEIWIEDTPGGGATFAFSLPAATERPEPSEDSRRPAQAR